MNCGKPKPMQALKSYPKVPWDPLLLSVPWDQSDPSRRSDQSDLWVLLRRSDLSDLWDL